MAAIETHWAIRFGAATVNDLRRALEQVVGDPADRQSKLWAGAAPYPDGWRASVRRPDTFPQFPMVLHRGGFPDGS